MFSFLISFLLLVLHASIISVPLLSEQIFLLEMTSHEWSPNDGAAQRPVHVNEDKSIAAFALEAVRFAATLRERTK